MNNSDRLDKSAKAESLYKFFKDNAFLTSGNVQLKSNYSRGKESPWSLAFAGHCVKDVFKIDDPMFCSKFVCHTYLSYSLPVMIDLGSISNNSAILSIVGRVGWVILLHHFDTVTYDTPSCSASQVPVFFFSTRTSFRRFKSLCSMFKLLNSEAKITNVLEENEWFLNFLILFAQILGRTEGIFA